MKIKNIILLFAVIIFSFNPTFAEWKQVDEGTYVSGFNRNNDFITYSTKVYKNSNMWQQYVNAHDFSAENVGDFDSIIINSTYDCLSSRIRVDNVQMYDNTGEKLGEHNDGTWKEDYNGFGKAICIMTQKY